VGMVVAQYGATANLNDSVAATVESLEAVDLHVSAASGTSLATDVLLPFEWRSRLAALPGVREVAATTFVYVNMARGRVLVQGLSHSFGAEPAAAGLTAAERHLVESGKAAVVSTRFEELYGVGAGETLSLPTPRGIRRVPVIGTFSTFTWEGGVVGVGRRPVIDWFGIGGVSDFLLAFDRGAEGAAVRESVDRFVADSPVPAYITTGPEYLSLVRATISQISRLFDALAAVVVGAAIMAIFNALLISVIERRRELGIMRALGTSRRQMRTMVGIEAVCLGVVGGVVGVFVGFSAHRATITAVARQAGMPIFYGFVVAPALAAFVVGMAMAVLGSLEPARRAGSLNIIEAIGYE
ncbi:MAG: ABC transporter permease, partial [Actinomycetota bacterium]